jgi:hypothetical protein
LPLCAIDIMIASRPGQQADTRIDPGPRPRPPHAGPDRRCRGRARRCPERLVAIIDEVIYRLDAESQVPVSVAVRRAPDGGVVVFFTLVPVAEAEITGAIPKAASLHDLRCAPDAARRWSCAVAVERVATIPNPSATGCRPQPNRV